MRSTPPRRGAPLRYAPIEEWGDRAALRAPLFASGRGTSRKIRPRLRRGSNKELWRASQQEGQPCAARRQDVPPPGGRRDHHTDASVPARPPCYNRRVCSSTNATPARSPSPRPKEILHWPSAGALGATIFAPSAARRSFACSNVTSSPIKRYDEENHPQRTRRNVGARRQAHGDERRHRRPERSSRKGRD